MLKINTKINVYDNNTHMKILVVFALKKEAESFLHAFAMKHYTAYHDIYYSEEIYALITGIGYENALSACNKAIKVISPDYIINTGSAGSLSLVAQKKSIYQISIVQKQDAHPITLAQCNIKKDHHAVKLLTTMNPLIDDDDRRKFSESADCVDMEGYAIALSAEQKRIPCSIIKIISDTYGDSDMKKIRRSIMDLSSVLCSHLSDEIIPYLRSIAENDYSRTT
jgi:nucleoside phosphorylase